MQNLTRSSHLLNRLSHPSSLTPTLATAAALGRTCCCLCLLTPSVVVTPPHRRVPRASLTDAPPVPPHQVQRFCVTLPFCVCFVRPSAQGRLLLRVLRAFRLLRCVKLFYQIAKVAVRPAFKTTSNPSPTGDLAALLTALQHHQAPLRPWLNSILKLCGFNDLLPNAVSRAIRVHRDRA